jgi:hypothetical protein
MSNYHYFKFTVFLTILFCLASCKKDENNEKGKPSTVKITRITINSYPVTNGAVPWDDPFIGSATGPDVNWKITGPENFNAGTYFPDCNGDTLITSTNFPIYLQNPESAHTISLWDMDDLDGSDLGSDDDLMVSANFTPWSNEGDEERQALIITSTNTEIILDVIFLYE